VGLENLGLQKVVACLRFVQFDTFNDEKLAYVLMLGTASQPTLKTFTLLISFTGLHPYYKLGYIKIAWGSEEEQAAEIAACNPIVKNWQREAEIIIEQAVHDMF
jgi:hypothetical protein